MNYLLTVVIPNYNGMTYIGECIDSLLKGSVVPRIIVVDNGSADGSASFIKEKYVKDTEPTSSGVTLLELGANTGFCHAVNSGIHLTTTEYVVLLNNDIRVDEHCMEELLAAMDRHPAAFSVQARMLSMQEPDRIDDAGDFYCALGWGFARGKGKPAGAFPKETEIFSACAGAAIYRMSALQEIGLFDERHFCYLEDVDIGYRARIFGYRNYYAPAAVVYHAGSATSGSRYNPFKEELTPGNNAYLLYKNMPSWQYVLNWPLIFLGRTVKQLYFRKRGLGEAYEDGLLRGRILISRAKDLKVTQKYDLTYPKGNLCEEGCLTGHDELQNYLPLYLGTKIPFSLRNFPCCLKIQGLLWKNTVLRLFT